MKKTELKESLYTSLREVGLSEKEADLYLVSLQLGPSSIAVLAKHLGVSRPNVYKLIRGLENKGLTSYSDRKRYGRDFTVESPAVVLHSLERKRELLKGASSILTSSMPDLLSLYRQGDLPTNVKFFEGRNQFVNLFNIMLEETNETMQFFGSGDDFLRTITWEVETKWIKSRVAKGLWVDVLIIPGGELTRVYTNREKELRETKILEGIKPFTTSFQMFGNKIVFWQPKTPLAILLEDEYITTMMKSMFYFMWDYGTRVDQFEK